MSTYSRNPQIDRGVTTLKWKNDPYPGNCRRHQLVFRKFQVIPEYCFGCYKIVIAPHNVLELFKLMLVFEDLKLPDDNTRKCRIVTSGDVAGYYKGFIYIQDFEEAKEIQNIVEPIIREEVCSDIPMYIKRGCSNFGLVYPDYVNPDEKVAPYMMYPNEWREHEDYVDTHLAGDIKPIKRDSFNNPDFDATDFQTMYTWLAYASAVGDKSYIKISGTPVRPLPIDKPPFEVVCGKE